MGFILPIYSVGQAVFPMLVGWMFDRTGNYNGGFAVMTAAGLLGVLCILPIRTEPQSRKVT
jgi:sugar phosphate permease